MYYLIDGHNLIACLPDIQLDDPEDEVRLVGRLKNWAGGSRKRRITVYFDKGLLGGKDRRLSGWGVEVVFASTKSSADVLLIRHLKQLRNPAEYTLVSSDREIIAVAKERRVAHLTSAAFAALLEEKPAAPPAPADRELVDPSLSPGEVQEWLALFGPVQLKKKTKARSLPAEAPAASEPAKSPPTAKPSPPADPASLKVSDRKLTSDELDEWLSLFSDSE
jgi:predicted RNA-binding protein with PIN domain